MVVALKMPGKVLTGKKRKKKPPQKENKSPVKKKRTEDEHYTEIRFKFELRDANLTFLALEKFVKHAEEYNPGSKEYDIVAGYCRSSPECTEILQLLDGGKRKETEIYRIFGALEVILLRILDDLSKHAPMGKVILQKILSVGMLSVYFLLGPQVRATAVKTTLRMLGALVMLGEGGAKALLTQLDTTHKHVQLLFTRRDPKDSQDVRACLIHFIMAFLKVGGNSIVQQLISIKGFLSTLFSGLMQDRPADIELVLTSVFEKIVENETITKTQRLKLFNDYSLSQISRLYNWTEHAQQGGDNEEEGPRESETQPTEEKHRIVALTHKLLTKVCCSHTHGINFHDKTLGTSGKNQNQLLTNFLSAMSKTVEGREVQDLVCQILKNCPDQIRHYLPYLIKNIVPRPTKRWHSTMNFLCEIYKYQPERPAVLKSTQHHSAVKFVEMVMVHLTPIPQILNPVFQSLKHTHPTVRYIGMKFMGVLLQKAVNYMHCLKQESGKVSLYTQAEMEEILELFKENVLKVFPDSKLILSCWKDLLFPRKLSDQKSTPVKEGVGPSDSQNKENSTVIEEDVPEILVVDHMVEIEKALCLLQELSPSILSDNSGDINLLLEGVRKMSKIAGIKDGHEDEVMETDDKSHDQSSDDKSHDQSSDDKSQQRELLPQLYLLKLLSETDARKLPWTQQSQDGHSLMYLMLEMLSKMSEPNMLKSLKYLLVQLLHGTGLFEGHTRELELWMTHFTHSREQALILKSLSDTFTTYISNSMSYVDRLCIHMSKVVSMETEDSVMDDVAMETGSVNTVDSAVNAILDMDEEDFENVSDEKETATETGLRLPYTPLIIVALDIGKKMRETNQLNQEISNAFSLYLSGIIVDILHQQTEPVTIAMLLQDLHGNLILTDVLKYVESLLHVQKNVKKKSSESTMDLSKLYFTGSPVSLELISILSSKDVNQKNEDTVRNGLKSVDLNELNTLVDQLLLYNGVLLKFQRSEDVELLKFSWKILKTVIVIVNEEVAIMKEGHTAREEGDVLESTGEPHSSSDLNVKFLDPPQQTREDFLKEILQSILSHPSILAHFLFPSREVTLEKSTTGFCEDMVACLAEGLCSVLVEVKSLSGEATLSSSLVGYFDKCVTLLSDKIYLNRSSLISLLHHFVQSTKTFIKQEHVGKMLWILLSFSMKDLVNLKVKSLTEKGQLLIVLLDNVNNQDHSVIPVLGLHKLETLFRLLEVVDNNSIEKACLQMLSCYPLTSAAMPKSVFIKCLASKSQIRTEISCIVVCQNVEAREWFESWILERKLVGDHSIVLQVVLHYTNRCPERLSERKEILTKILGIFKKCLCLLEKSPEVSSQENGDQKIRFSPFDSIVNLTLSLHQMKILGTDLEEMVITQVSKQMSNRKNLSHHHVRILAELCRNSENVERRRMLLRNSQSCLLHSLKNKATREAIWVPALLDVLTSFEKGEVEMLCTSELIKDWAEFAKTLLRHKYSSQKSMQLLATMAGCLYKENSDEASTNVSSDLPIQQLHEMLISHSQYLPIMFNESHPEVKEALIDLMTLLVERNPLCCQTQHIGVLLGAYTASLSSTDQKLLGLLFLYEKNKTDLKVYRPMLWGMKAVETHSVKKSLGASLSKQTTAEEVMECLDQKTLQTSILKLPLRRKMQPGLIQEAQKIKSIPEAYDPCFLLPVFSDLVQSDSILDCRKFVENRCLSFTLACLSCHDSVVRGAAYHVLSNFFSQLQGARFPEVKQVLYFLEVVKNSIEKPNTKLPCIITLFLARVTTELLKPEDHMYRMLNAFMLLKPAMDVGNVPEFYTFFNSSATEYKIERAWMLSLLSEGLRETADFHIFEKRHVLKMLLSFYESSISDNTTQFQVLQILKSASRERKVTSDLVRNYGILTWFSVMMQSKLLSKNHLEMIIDIVHSIWNTMLGDFQMPVTDGPESPDSPERRFLPVTLTCPMGQLIRGLLTEISKEIRLESYCQLLETFSSVLGHADLGKVKAQGEGQSFPGDHWTIRDTLLLLGNICVYNNDLENLQSVNSILRVLKLEMASLVGSNLLPSSSNKLHNKVSRDLDNSRTQQDSEEMKKVIEHTLKLLIRWSPSYLLSTQSTETSLPLCTGVITVGLWFLEQSRNVISGHILELIVDWLHSALMSSDVLIKVLLDCPKKSQMMLEGLIGLYPNLNNCILGANKMAVAMQGKINVTDTVFVSADSRLEIMKKLNAMVCCLCEQRVGAKQKKWKEFLSRYKKLTDPENQSVTLTRFTLEFLSGSS
ncbi:nucleolar pre-ribosomal-associated protein 1-like isoform X1 [Crassostrea virginica]